MLHVAPEPALEQRLRASLGDGYLTADIDASSAMVQMDICRIQYPDDWFDVIYCGHVLEHVADDRLAMREFRRVLKPGGWAVLQVPIAVETTFEDPTVTDPAERTKLFGQADHVRSYGRDFADRLREAGFRVMLRTVHDIIGEEEPARLGLARMKEQIHHCTKEL